MGCVYKEITPIHLNEQHESEAETVLCSYLTYENLEKPQNVFT